MKKQLFIIPLCLLMLASCNGGNTSEEVSSSEAASSEVSSAPDSSSAVLSSSASLYNLEELKAILEGKHVYASLRTNGKITKDNKTFYSIFSRSEVDVEKGLYHRFGNTTSVSSLEDPTDSVTEEFNIYYTVDSTYTLGLDGKYVVTEEAHEIKSIELKYDFTKASDYAIDSNSSYTQVVSAKVSAENVDAFVGTSMDKVTDFEFKATITNLELASMSISYLHEGYLTSMTYDYSSLVPTITLPM